MFLLSNLRNQRLSRWQSKIVLLLLGISVLLGTWSTTAAQDEIGPLVPPLVVSQLAFPSYEEWWRQIPPELEKVGITVDVQPIEANTWIQNCSVERDCGTFTSTGFGVTDDRIDPNWYLTDVLDSRRAGANAGGSNLSNWTNEEVDALIAAQAVELDPEARRGMIMQIQEIVARETPFIPVYFINDVQAYDRTKFEGFLARPGAGISRFNNLTSFLNVRPLTDQTTLRIENNHDGNSTNPFVASGGLFNTATMLWIYDTLARTNENLETIPWAAESWEWVDDMTIDVKLREDMSFHDGEPVTAEDLVFTVNYAKEHEFPSWTGIFNVVAGVEQIDDYTARFTLNNAFAPFESNILTAIYIVPEHIWSEIDDPQTFANPEPIGSGPFTFGHWRPNESWLFNRNPNHFHAPQVDVLVAIIPTPEVWIGMLQNQELDANGTYIRGDAQIETLEAMDHLELVVTPGIGVQSIFIDTRVLPGSDLAFRRAVHHLIPKESLLDVVAGLGGGTVAGANWMHPSSEFYNPDTMSYPYDPETARAILAEAGYTWDEDGRLHYPASFDVES
jgi:peptide/nickel transport system substrate-binding protein